MEKEEFKRAWLPLSGEFYRAAYCILESEQEARDILQDLYVKLWNMRGSLQNIDSPLAYGTRVIRNMALDRVRSAQYRMRKDNIVAMDEISPSNAPAHSPVERGMIEKQMVLRLKRTVEQMQEPQRSIMRMRLFDDMDYGEIARKTGLSQINIRVMVSRGKRRIAEAIREYL